MDTEKTFRTKCMGRLIDVKTLTQGQMTVVNMFDNGNEEAAKSSLRRLFLIIESRMTPADWEELDTGFVTGTVDLPEVMALVRKMLEASAKAEGDQEG